MLSLVLSAELARMVLGGHDARVTVVWLSTCESDSRLLARYLSCALLLTFAAAPGAPLPDFFAGNDVLGDELGGALDGDLGGFEGDIDVDLDVLTFGGGFDVPLAGLPEFAGSSSKPAAAPAPAQSPEGEGHHR